MFRGTSNFDKLLEKATSHLLLEPDWNTILQLCDCIRQGDVQPKYALSAVKKKLYHQNPHVILYALQVLESWVKNCGTAIHQEVATKEYMEDLKNILKISTNEAVKNKILELIQTWAHAFRNEPSLRAMQDTLNLLKVEGHTFPVLKESDAMFSADQAPKWVDGECCHRCRVQFGMVQRKHHCRNCGQVFCAKCTSHNLSIPRLGFEKEVRVCDACFESLSKVLTTSSKSADSELPHEYLASSLSQQPQVPPSKSEQEMQEEEDLQLAIALSKSEAENREKEKMRATSSILSMKTTSAGPIVSSAPSPSLDSMESDPELARYLNRNYWEQKQQADSKLNNASLGGTVTVNSVEGPIPSAPVSYPNAINASLASVVQPLRVNDAHQNGEVDDLNEFVSTLRSNLEIFVNRMKSNSSRGRSIAVDSTVQTFFLNITAMHSQLLRFIQEQDDKRVYYESLQDKLSQAKDARAALDALREDHRDRLRREAEEAERQRQIQMAQKLEIMRKKKQEYLEYQRQIAMQRMQEQEREMQLRQEQQKQQYMRQLATGGYPPTMPPPGSASQQPAPPGSFIPPQQNFAPQQAPPQSTNDSPVHNSQNPVAFQPQYHYPPAGSQPMFQPQPPPQEFRNFKMHSLSSALPQVSHASFPSQVIQPSGLNQSQVAPPLPNLPSHPHNPTAVTGPPANMPAAPPIPPVQPNIAEPALITFD